MNKKAIIIVNLNDKDFDMLKDSSSLPDEQWFYLSSEDKEGQRLLNKLIEAI